MDTNSDINVNLPSNSFNQGAHSDINDIYFNDDYLKGLQGNIKNYQDELASLHKKASFWEIPAMKSTGKLLGFGLPIEADLKSKIQNTENALKQAQMQYDAYFNNELQRHYLKKTLEDKRQMLADMGISDKYLVNMSNMFDSNYVKTGEWNMSGVDSFESKKDDNLGKALMGLLVLALKFMAG